MDPAAGLEFLLTEIETGLVFAQVARSASSPGDKKFLRNKGNAEKAYLTILRFRPEVSLSAEHEERFQEALCRLELALHDLSTFVEQRPESREPGRMPDA